jgi:outer membrane protein
MFMRLTISRRPRIIWPLLIFGFFICGPLTVSSFAADSRIGFVDIQKAVSGTKEWKSSFNKFKSDFTKEKKKNQDQGKKDPKNAGGTEQTKFCSGPGTEKEKGRPAKKRKNSF